MDLEHSTPRPRLLHLSVAPRCVSDGLAVMGDFQCGSTHVVAGLLRLVTLLVLLGLLLVRLTLLIVECLPSLTEDLADLA